jgi:hypothetical protein
LKKLKVIIFTHSQSNKLLYEKLTGEIAEKNLVQNTIPTA